MAKTANQNTSPVITKIGNGANGCFIENNRFKTNRISVNLLLPLTTEGVSAGACLPFLLSRRSRQYSDFRLLNARLAELYGAYIAADAAKLGDVQVLRLVVSALDDRFTMNNEQIGKECAELLCSLLFDPPFENGCFKDADFKAEQRLFIELIEGEINDKRRYAISRCEGEMCADEPYGIPKYGTPEAARALSAADLTAAWKSVVSSAALQVNVLGSTDPSPIFEQFKKALPDKRTVPDNLPNKVVRKAAEEPKTVTERLDIAQGKLCLGFRAGTAETDRFSTAARVMTDLFGGGPYSKLFQNVRERLSLCYYCAARYHARKGLVLVDSGVEFENKDKAVNEILNQLESLRKGDFSAEELAASKMSLENAAKTISDSPSDLDKWYLDRIFLDKPISPEAFAQELQEVEAKDIIAAAKRVSLDTIYSLEGDPK